ncbi:OCIA domain-containing protein 1 [Denticeps clupeoides]|uniref:OCIA domain-containing protein 1 n=1 Tax=Denticeps clupeoides TaxID=299321 RepID=A0AAY4DUY2_9TELE|nr:OCIA domain-containing protein 1 [Denticeps clupeoides]
MSQASSGFSGPRQEQRRDAQAPLSSGYIPTEDEKRVFRECNQESFWYRSLPFSALAVAVTQVLISRGVLTGSPRFGSLPKVAFAGLMGYMGGKMSYMKVCQEKFKNLENSPLGEALRHAQRQQAPGPNQSEFWDPNQADPNQATFESSFQPATNYQPPADSYSYSSDDYSNPSFSSFESAPFSSSFSESAPSGMREDAIPQAPTFQEEDTPKKKAILYEELRSKNRENYEVTLTQKAETLLKPQSETSAPKKEVKQNQYGDAWEE